MGSTNWGAVCEWVYRGMAITFGVIVMLGVLSPVLRVIWRIVKD